MKDFSFGKAHNTSADTYLSQIETFDNFDGSRSVRKINRSILKDRDNPVRVLLDNLSNTPHPHLLTPEAFHAEPGQRLNEFYPYVEDNILGRVNFAIREGIIDHQLDEGDLVHMMLQLCDATAYIHQLGLVHRDIRAQNIFVRLDEQNLHVTLFDYSSVCRPYHQAHGIESWNLEIPPEVKEGDADVDARMDVYALGYLIYDLTHNDEGSLFVPLDPTHPLFNVMAKAMASLLERLGMYFAGAKYPRARNHLANKKD